MPLWLQIVIPLLLALIVLLAVGGALAGGRRMRQQEKAFTQHLGEIDRALAAARAEDRGWDPEVVVSAARSLFEQQQPGVEIKTIDLVQVIDRPGTDQDKAVFTIITADREVHLTLGRENGSWILDSLD